MKVRMQGAIQKWVDHSISVTVNLPNDVSEELVGKLYVEAWRSGCKGCTIYRDGSRSGVMISASKKDKKKSATQKEKVSTDRIPVMAVTETRPKELDCDVVRFQNNKEKWVAFVGLLSLRDIHRTEGRRRRNSPSQDSNEGPHHQADQPRRHEAL